MGNGESRASKLPINISCNIMGNIGENIKNPMIVVIIRKTRPIFLVIFPFLSKMIKMTIAITAYIIPTALGMVSRGMGSLQLEIKREMGDLSIPLYGANRGV